jgi:predicted DCC family thiol-disulfide oxidoreductase YuxK
VQVMMPLPSTPDARETEKGAVVLFDGHCNLCSATVAFVAARDPRGYFKFASLQSSAAARLLAAYDADDGRATRASTLVGGEADPWQSVVLIEDGRVFRRSTAALRMLRHLRMPWPLLAIALIVPAPLRDPFYTFIARRRYRWVGRRDTCMVPTEKLRARFLD